MLLPYHKPGLDFTALNEVISFSMGEVRRCTVNNISIMTDNIVESIERFSIQISSNDVQIDPVFSFGTTVSISDLSSKYRPYNHHYWL